MNKPKSKKSTREEAEKRIDAIVVFLVNGASAKEIIAYAIKTWGVVASRVYQQIDEARRWIKTSRVVDREFELAKGLLRREALYQKGLREEGVFAALAVEKDRCSLLGLYEPLTLELTDSRKNPYAHLSKEEARSTYAALEEIKLGARPCLVPALPKEAKLQRNKG